MFAGLFIGIAQVLIRDFFRHGISDTELVEKKLAISTYAVILYSDKQKSFNREMRKQSQDKRSFILAQSAPHDSAIEGIRCLRTMLQFSMENKTNNVINILGASPGIGKSFISINLAQVLVDAGKRILLIDTDMRKGKIYQHFGCEKTPGLAELLLGEAQLDSSVVTISNGFDFIPTGNYPHKPTELLMGQAFQNLIAALAKNYDHIIIDTPPVLAVSDAIIVAKHAATNLMIVGMATNQLDELEVAVKRIRKNGIAIDGLVFNDNVNLKKTHKQYNYYYAYDVK